MRRWNARTLKRWKALELGALLLWLEALIAYFAPWIARQPVSAALAWNAYDLFDLLRFLPEIETGAVTVNLQALRLPLLGLAVLLPVLLSSFGNLPRLAGALLGCALALLTFPPYPQILTAWRTPGWRVPFWWGIGTIICALVSVWLAPRLAWARDWWIVGVVQLVTVPAIITLRRLLPPLRTLHAAWVYPGWGFWGCILGLGAIGLAAWLRASFSRNPGPGKTAPRG